MSETITIDALGLRCPLPVLKAEKQLAAMAPGNVLIILADDPIAGVDIPLMCQKLGYKHTKTATGNALRFEITKA